MGPSKPQSSNLLGNRDSAPLANRTAPTSKISNQPSFSLVAPNTFKASNEIAGGSPAASPTASPSGSKISGPLDHPSKVLARNPKAKERRSFASKLKEKFFGRLAEEQEEEEQDDTIVSTPFNVTHNIHVDFDSETGFSVS